MEQEITSVVTSIPFYQDMKFWAVIISFVSVVLSQFPPVRQWFKKARIEIESYTHINLSQHIGNPNVHIFLMLRNTGGRDLRIKKIEGTIFRDQKEITTLMGLNYKQKHSDNEVVLFTPFSLRPKQEWAHEVGFSSIFERDDSKEYSKLISNIRSDITSKMKDSNGQHSSYIEAEPENVNAALEFFDKKFIWTAGEYELKLKVITEKEKADIQKTLSFTLFESQQDDLVKAKDEFKYGAGIYWQSGNLTPVFVKIKEA